MACAARTPRCSLRIARPLASPLDQTYVALLKGTESDDCHLGSSLRVTWSYSAPGTCSLESKSLLRYRPKDVCSPRLRFPAPLPASALADSPHACQPTVADSRGVSQQVKDLSKAKKRSNLEQDRLLLAEHVFYTCKCGKGYQLGAWP